LDMWEGIGDFFEYLIWGAVSAVGLWFSNLLLTKKLLTFSTFAAYALVSEELIAGVYEMVRIAKQIGSGNAPARGLVKQLYREPNLQLDGQKSLLDNVQTNFHTSFHEDQKLDIEFVDVTVEIGKRAILREVSFKIPFGEIFVIVGQSGCGKSTLLSLLKRQIRPISGQVLIGGMNILDLPLEVVYDLLGVATQKAVVFRRTLKENLNFGNSVNIEDKRVATILQGIKYHPDDMLEPEKLSGGEKQRIALARVLLKNAKILLLDEITSGLDLETESLVMNALYSWGCFSWMMVVHRLEIIQDTSWTVVLQSVKHKNDKSIIESAPFKELKNGNGWLGKSMRRASKHWSEKDEPHLHTNRSNHKSQ